MNPPLLSEISAFEPPSLLTFRGGGMDIFWNHTIESTISGFISPLLQLYMYMYFLLARWVELDGV